MPWLKRIDLGSGESTRLELTHTTGMTLARRRRRDNPIRARQVSGDVRLFAEEADGVASWFAEPSVFSDVSRGLAPEDRRLRAPAERDATVRRLSHGATLYAGEAAYVFMEYPEKREPALEVLAAQSQEGAQVWADWLDAQGDPYGTPLRAMLEGRIFGGRERWWLEGIDRGITSVGTEFDMRDGLLRRAALRGSTLPIDLHLLHITGLRVAQALEDLTIPLSSYLPASYWLPFARWSFWLRVRWPASMKVLRLSSAEQTKSLEHRQCAEEIQRALQGIHVEP